ncbi:uncharacterized protein LOC124364308 isoform X2 [Homalodisca vitripennis]|uniref:uncharacterized protein LOC124364308 isoform X2 n=1 Tax=Homalodisca vitripennis TaxID=197043 RepID=UPI001EEA0AE2|nr:uncharacterized protein LOC124364308 isoform X2 [Homalodisca vitripennis]
MASLPVFDNEMVLRFIRNYRENQCLWDFSSPAYKNKAARDEAYERLVAAMDLPGLTVLDVKNKIKNIRSTYCQELKKIQTARMLGREPYVPSVFWFKDLDSFLHSNTTPRTEVADKKVPKYLTKFHNLPPQSAPPTDFYYQQCPSVEETNHSFPEPPDGELPLFVQQSSVVSLAEDPEPAHSEVSEPQPKRRRRDRGDDDLADQMRDAMKHLKNITSLLTSSEDEFELFGRSVALQLKKMSLCTALTVQAKIQHLLSQYRISDIKREAKDRLRQATTNEADSEENKCEDKVKGGEEHPEASSPQLSLTCASETSDNEATEVG